MKKHKKLLQKYQEEELDESYYNPEKGWERFKETLDIRMRIQDEMRRTMAGEVSLADYPDYDDPIKISILDKINIFFMRSPVKQISMVASLIIALVIGGAAGSYAQQQKFLNNIVCEEEKKFTVLSPTESDNQFMYTEIEKIPIKYVRFLWALNNVPEELPLESIIITESKYNIKAKCEYKKGKKFITATKETFEENFVISDQLFDGFTSLKKSTINGINIEFLTKENSDYTEYIALFTNANSRYTLISNYDIDLIEIIIENCINGNNF